MIKHYSKRIRREVDLEPHEWERIASSLILALEQKSSKEDAIESCLDNGVPKKFIEDVLDVHII